MLIDNVNKINKSFLPNITFILNVLSDERTFRKWHYFCLNGLIFQNQKIMLVSKKCVF